MAIGAAARSVFRSSNVRNAAAKMASSSSSSSGAKASSARSAFRIPSTTPRNPLSQRLFRSPVELSAMSLQPYHTATASALMTSMLTVSHFGFGWLPEGI